MKRICIDPGHGGKDNGAEYGGEKEDDLALIVSLLLEYELLLKGFGTIMTRRLDMDVSLDERCQIANDNKSALFVSVHCDAWHSASASGITVHKFPRSTKSTKLAESVKHQLGIFCASQRQRSIKDSKFQVLEYTKMPAVLVECEFLSSPGGRKFLVRPENQKRIAVAIARGIENYFN